MPHPCPAEDSAWRSSARNAKESCGGDPRQRVILAELGPFARRPSLDFAHPLVQPLRADDERPRQADHIHGRKLRSASFVAVVVEGLDTGRLKPGIERVT